MTAAAYPDGSALALEVLLGDAPDDATRAALLLDQDRVRGSFV